MTKSEIQLCINALAAVSATGGSTPEWRLYSKLCIENGLEVEMDRAVAMQNTVARELELIE